jgi:hypothetical protein
VIAGVESRVDFGLSGARVFRRVGAAISKLDLATDAARVGRRVAWLSGVSATVLSALGLEAGVVAAAIDHDPRGSIALTAGAHQKRERHRADPRSHVGSA